MMFVTGWRSELEAMISANLPATLAETFARLPLRPAVRLSAARPGDPVVGQLGGMAPLPVGMPWPVVRGLPLQLAARLDCAALGAYEVDLDLPGSGALLFFVPNPERFDEAETTPVVYIPESSPTAEQPMPSGLPAEYVYPYVPLTARSIATAPKAFNPALGEDFASIQALSDMLRHQTYSGRTVGEVIVAYRGSGPDHQVGGYSDAMQHPLEISAAYETGQWPAGANLYEDPTFLAEARGWVTLLQLDEDTSARMIWGDGAIALWAIRRTDLARRDFDAVYFTTDGH